ncbi:MAG: hypothetical protein DRP89_04135 [Candidatus Neomarinimicrobiota bacterium]|nr:MAG: hypothetical protein DRP89_04135 [Candidatus Neomarinimicrobiota bacterium]
MESDSRWKYIRTIQQGRDSLELSTVKSMFQHDVYIKYHPDTSGVNIKFFQSAFGFCFIPIGLENLTLRFV